METMVEPTYKEKYDPKIKEFTCFNTQLRIINFAIYMFYIWGKRHKRLNWAEEVATWLYEKYGILRAPDTYKEMLKKIIKGERDAVCSSGFTETLEPKSRYKKDELYARLDVYIHEYLDGEISYIGLPANQLVWAAQKYDSVVACEKETHLMCFMMELNKYIIKRDNVKVVAQDIFEYLDTTEEKFNVYDFDLMEALTESRIEQIANSIKRTAQHRAVIDIISVGGRHITTKEYERIMPSKLIAEIGKEGQWRIMNRVFCDGYKDQNFPMRIAILVIERIK